MRLRVTEDIDAIYDAIFESFYDIVEDDTEMDCAMVDMQKRLYLEAYDDEGTIGFYEIKPHNRTMLEVHPFIRKSRRRDSFKSAELVKDWFNSDQCPSMYKSLVTQSPEFYRHIRIFLLRLGFEIAGRYKKAFTKNGEQHDLLNYQLMRNE